MRWSATGRVRPVAAHQASSRRLYGPNLPLNSGRQQCVAQQPLAYVAQLAALNVQQTWLGARAVTNSPSLDHGCSDAAKHHPQRGAGGGFRLRLRSKQAPASKPRQTPVAITPVTASIAAV